MSNPVYVRVEGSDDWHYLGSTDEIEIKQETSDLWNRSLLMSNSYYIELKQ